MPNDRTLNLCLSIDPGIQNTGWAIIGRNAVGKFRHIESGVSKAKSTLPLGQRLAIHWQCLSECLDSYPVDLIAIESVFFNRNIVSHNSTTSVIAIAELIAAVSEIKAIQVLPQAVKASVGAGAGKAHIVKMVNRILGVHLTNHHEADAAAVAIAGFLKMGVDR